MSKFLKLINSVVLEQGLGDLPNKQSEDINMPAEPTAVSDDSSALPTPKDVSTIDTIKYKNLLKALREALFNAAKGDLEKQREISNINVDTADTEEQLKKIDNDLMSFLGQKEVIPTTEE
jgi:hypothetical protein